MSPLPKAASNDIPGRFREIISDPINLLIKRVPHAGFTQGPFVFLHNGLRVPVTGPDAYYGQFSTILVMNRGVHEPLEEFVFQQVLRHMPETPRMLELGAYWSHYSMWLKSVRPKAELRMVEPDSRALQAGQRNLKLNGMDGEFLQASVGKGGLLIDPYLGQAGIARLQILHTDIQGYEVEMLESAPTALSRHAIDYVFISTHSQSLHQAVIQILQGHGYRVEVSSDFDQGSTSFDGLVMASSPRVARVFTEFRPMARVDILSAAPPALVDYLSRTTQLTQR